MPGVHRALLTVERGILTLGSFLGKFISYRTDCKHTASRGETEKDVTRFHGMHGDNTLFTCDPKNESFRRMFQIRDEGNCKPAEHSCSCEGED